MLIGVVPGATQLSLANAHACVATTRSIHCWGSDRRSQLSEGAIVDGMVVPPLPQGTTVTSVATGWDHTCVLQSGGIVCFGAGAQGAEFPAALELTSIAAGEGRTCALSNAGALLCWGREFGVPLGAPNPSFIRPTLVAEDTAAFDLGTDSVCTVDRENRVRCWGMILATTGTTVDGDPSQPPGALLFGVPPEE
ncbi:hypothetical protein [Sandaracinus amylolyticus]|uniref:hypothetical protein n=1 Tax=Sandaracinus amylolyticus TaxID=927083 RepID=UPI001F458139|nr:hypothetical protein [Sandaracinus amylolyticus]